MLFPKTVWLLSKVFLFTTEQITCHGRNLQYIKTLPPQNPIVQSCLISLVKLDLLLPLPAEIKWMH